VFVFWDFISGYKSNFRLVQGLSQERNIHTLKYIYLKIFYAILTLLIPLEVVRNLNLLQMHFLGEMTEKYNVYILYRHYLRL
jgi:hypothetical protein